MNFPEHIEEKIGFDQVRSLLKQHTLSEGGAAYADKMRFSSDFDLVEKWLQQAHEFKELLEFDTAFPSDNYLNVSVYFSRMRLEGAFLLEEEFFSLLKMLRTVEAVFRYFEQRPEKYPELQNLFRGLSFNRQLTRSIESKISEEGLLRPNASRELADLYRSITEQEREVRKKLNTIYKKAQESGWTAESGITIRNERLVIPVLAEHKRHLKGFVHDESATSQTFYIEPAEVFEINNEIRQLQLALRKEKERILIALTTEIRPCLPELDMYQQKLGLVDFIRAKALLAIQLKASKPVLQKDPLIQWVQAYHPLLWLHHQRLNKPIIPLVAELHPEQRILVISGPNAGGKSVCMKTLALLQYMLQCGLLLSASPNSVCTLFREMFVDIGDDQSIENDLSTYSSHLQHMKYFMDFAGRRTLFFIDEFGTGTDPQFGGPIAEAVLLQLNQKQAFGVITTHYSNIKTFASNTRGIVNASMLFDHERMQPLYVLETGKPGSSHAFEIAQRNGFARHVLDYARARSGHKQLNVDDLLLELQQDRIEINRLKAELEKKETELQGLLNDYSRKHDELQSQRRQLLLKAKEEAMAIISQANSRIENTIREIKSSKAESQSTRQLREELKQETQQLQEELKQLKSKTPVPKPAAKSKVPAFIEVGSYVKLKDSQSSGQVMEIRKNKAIVSLGAVHSSIALERLEPIAPPAEEKSRSYAGSGGMDMTEKYRGFSTELNVIGERGEDALRKLRAFIDDAYLLGFKSLRVVHGKGDGILRRLILDELKRHEMVSSFGEAHIELGGAGVTLVEIK